MSRWFRAAMLSGLVCFLSSPTFASRAELDGRGLPYLLATDPSLVVLFPGSAALFGGSALVDYSQNPSSNGFYDYIDTDALRYVGPLVRPVNAAPQRFILGLAGKSLAFGYAMDGQTHNLVLSHRSGWGVSVGIEDQYDNRERSDQVITPSNPRVDADAFEISRRDLRFGLGWSMGNASKRVYEFGAALDVVYTQYSVTQVFANSDTTVISSGEWKSEPGFGFDVRLRTLSPVSGFQGAFRFAYEDLQPEVTSGPPAVWIRRYGLSELGWRFDLKELDDLVAGVILEWSEDTFSGPVADGFINVDTQSAKVTRYYGQIFGSAERVIVGHLIGRAGVRGSAYFLKQKSSRTQIELGGSQFTTNERSQGAIADPEIFLGAGWTWKRFTIDGHLNENISLTYPVTQWSVSYAW